MLTTGMRTAVGLKITGPNLQTIDAIGSRIEAVLPTCRVRENVSPSGAAGDTFSTSTGSGRSSRRFGLSIDDAPEHRP